MKQPSLEVVSYGEPNIESLDNVFYTALLSHITELKGGVANVLSSSSGSVNGNALAVKGNTNKTEN